MTAPKTMNRAVRHVAGGDSTRIPDDLIQWFSGELDSPPWSALLPPDYELLPDRWLAFKATHPNARPPAGYESLDAISTNPKGN